MAVDAVVGARRFVFSTHGEERLPAATQEGRASQRRQLGREPPCRLGVCALQLISAERHNVTQRFRFDVPLGSKHVRRAKHFVVATLP